jgi:hypothetical protein
MKRLLALIAALVASLAVYAMVFAVVQRPLTLGDLTRQLDYKLDLGGRLPSPKIVILAGSNGRYSHRCQSFTEVLQRPCLNASIASGIGLDFLLDQYGAILRSGDVVYMPLEYSQYAASEAEMHGGVHNAVLFRHRRDHMPAPSLSRLIEAHGAYDLPFLLRGMAEMALARTSFRRRTGVETLTAQGDEAGHTEQKSAAYVQYLATAAPPDTHVPDSSHAIDVLSAFLAEARERGITVVGGLPTVPLDTPIDARDLERIRRVFESNGQRFVVTTGLSRYPRSCFFDTTYHLNETCQARHSLVVAHLLRGL